MPGPDQAQEAQDAAVAALRRIAFLLERAQQSKYRSEAFRGAARSVEAVPGDALADLVGRDAVATLPGVGQSSAQVVVQAVQGRPVEYLARVEAEHDRARPDEGADLLAQLRGDLHTHTEASDGVAPMQEMVLAAMELGREYIAVTDHSPRLTIANGLSAARLRAQLDQVAALDRAVRPFRVLTGIEVDIHEDGRLDQDPELLARLDVVVASVHSQLRMPRAEMTARMLRAVADPHTDVLGHCTGRQVTGRLRPQSEFDAQRVFEACVEHGVAVEVNCRPDRLDPPHDLLALALEIGCDVVVDTDSHAPGQLDWLDTGAARLARHGIDPSRVLTTLPADELVARFAR